MSLESSGMIPATHLGAPAVWLQNSFLRAALLPDLGAKLASLVYRPQSYEVLAQPQARAYRRPAYGAPFADFDTSGADDMFPTIDACPYPLPPHAGVLLPDHGEVWSQPWDLSVEGELLVATVRSKALPLVLRRTVQLDRDRLHFTYRVRNEGAAPAAFLWAFHGLLACDERTRLDLGGVREVILAHDSPRLGPRGTRHAYPETHTLTGEPYRLDQVPPRTAGTTEKFYVAGPVGVGEASVLVNRGRLRYTVRFPREHVPYLGVWLNGGGFKGEHNLALEPTTGCHDDLARAHAAGSGVTVQPGEAAAFALTIAVTPT